MYSFEVENEFGIKLKLTQNESNFQIVKIDGLTPPSANIYTNVIANMHGELYKNSRITMRNIVIQIKIRGNIEQNRIKLYDFFSPSKWCKLHYRNKSRNVFIDGYIENLEDDLFSNSQIMQVSIICPDPFFKDENEIVIDISKQYDAFEFPFEIDSTGIEFSTIDTDRSTIIVNYGDVDSGMIIELSTVQGTINNPVIYNYQTGEQLRINDSINEGETIIVNTNRGKKSLIKIVDGVERNIINKFDIKTTWLQLRRGANYFTYNSDIQSENLKVEIKQNTLYLGV